MEDADLKKIHPMTKKSIKTFIEKNGLDKAYIDKIENLKTIQDFINFSESIKDESKDLADFIAKKFENKIKDTVKDPYYLEFDFAILGKITGVNNKELQLISDKKAKEIKDLLNKEVIDYDRINLLVKELRNERKDKINIHEYCLDGLARIVKIILRNLNIMAVEYGKRNIFLEAIDVTESKTAIRPEALEYFNMGIEEIKLNDKQKDYIFQYSKKNNVKKSIFSAKKINTVKDFTNLLCTLTKNMLVGSKEDMLDYYSIKKVFELYEMLV